MFVLTSGRGELSGTSFIGALGSVVPGGSTLRPRFVKAIGLAFRKRQMPTGE